MALEAVGIKSDLAMGHPGPSACHCSGDAVEKGELYHMGICKFFLVSLSCPLGGLRGEVITAHGTEHVALSGILT